MVWRDVASVCGAVLSGSDGGGRYSEVLNFQKNLDRRMRLNYKLLLIWARRPQQYPANLLRNKAHAE